MQFTTALALDIGDKRIGVARAGSIARLPQPLATLPVDGHELNQLRQLIEAEQADLLVLGLPRDLKGNETAQTAKARAFGSQLHELGLPIVWQDEALTSKAAEAEMAASGKGDVDALAATYILEDFLREHPA